MTATTGRSAEVWVVVVLPGGPLDAHASTLRAMVEAALDAGAGTVVLDLGPADPHRGVGLGVLMQCAARVSARHAVLVVAGAGPLLAGALDRTRLADLVRIEATAEEAVAGAPCRPTYVHLERAG